MVESLLGRVVGIANDNCKSDGDHWDVVRSPVTPGKENPLLMEVIRQNCNEIKARGHLQPVYQVGYSGCYFGALGQVQIQRLD